jgi:hypothetical protein
VRLDVADVADVEWSAASASFEWGAVYVPRLVPVWQNIDGCWELQSDRVVGVVDSHGRSSGEKVLP